jgi:GT2 family glycosyltransferase
MSESCPLMVSVVIVSWNAREFLVQCLNSLSTAACRYPIEVIVVDNDSDDGSPTMVERQFPAVKLFRNQANLGFAKANNVGIRHSSGKYICLINSDVKVLPSCISKLVDYMEAHADAGMVGPQIIGGDGRLQRSCRGFPTTWNMFCRALALDVILPRCRWFGGYLMPYWKHDHEKQVDILSGCFWTVRRKALDTVGLLDEDFFMYGEDMDWCKRFAKAGWGTVFVPKAEAIHYGGASSANAPVRFYVEKHRADLQYWRKHHSTPAVGLYILLTCLHLLLRATGHSLTLLHRSDGRENARHKLHRSLVALRWIVSNGLKAQPRSRVPMTS